MKEYIARNKDNRLIKKVRETIEFRGFHLSYLTAVRENPTKWMDKLIFKYIPNTFIGKWRHSQRKRTLCKAMSVTVSYFDRMSYYL